MGDQKAQRDKNTKEKPGQREHSTTQFNKKAGGDTGQKETMFFFQILPHFKKDPNLVYKILESDFCLAP